MNKTLATFLFILTPFFVFGQEDTDCEWINQLENSTVIKDQLKLIQGNFESCVLIAANGIPVSSEINSGLYAQEEDFINVLRPEEIRSIIRIPKKAGQTLYGSKFENVVVITFVNDQVIDSIRERVLQRSKQKY